MGAKFAFAILLASAVLEAVWATALGLSDGFSQAIPTVVFAVTATLSMIGLGIAAALVAVAGLGTSGPLLGFAGLWGVPFLQTAYGLERTAAAALSTFGCFSTLVPSVKRTVIAAGVTALLLSAVNR